MLLPAPILQMKKRRLVLGYKLVLYPNTPTSCTQEEACVGVHGGYKISWSESAGAKMQSCVCCLGTMLFPPLCSRGKASEVDGFSLSLTAASVSARGAPLYPQEVGQTGFFSKNKKLTTQGPLFLPAAAHLAKQQHPHIDRPCGPQPLTGPIWLLH